MQRLSPGWHPHGELASVSPYGFPPSSPRVTTGSQDRKWVSAVLTSVSLGMRVWWPRAQAFTWPTIGRGFRRGPCPGPYLRQVRHWSEFHDVPVENHSAAAVGDLPGGILWGTSILPPRGVPWVTRIVCIVWQKHESAGVHRTRQVKDRSSLKLECMTHTNNWDENMKGQQSKPELLARRSTTPTRLSPIYENSPYVTR